MVSYPTVPLPTCQPRVPAGELAASIRRWVSSPPLRDLVAEFGGHWPELETGALLDWLDRFSAEHWDFRERSGSVERDEVDAGPFPPQRVELVGAAARALGLSEPLPPPGRGYHHLLVLGGLARACLVRSGYAAHLLGTGAVEAPSVAALGSFRPLRTPETGLLERLGWPGCRYEVDAMAAGVRMAFGFGQPHARESATDQQVTHRSWSVWSYRAPDRPAAQVLAAPSTEPEARRATTPDTYHFWARRVTLSARDRVLVVTSPIYVPFQHCDAVRALGLRYGCGVDTVGFDPALVTEPLLRQTFGPDRYLQELRSGIRSMRDLFHALSQPARA